MESETEVDLFLEIMGWAAMGMILIGYFLISTNKVDSRNITYQLLNLVGSILFVIYLSIKEAWASVGLNAAWAIIALCSLWAIFSKSEKITLAIAVIKAKFTAP